MWSSYILAYASLHDCLRPFFESLLVTSILYAGPARPIHVHTLTPEPRAFVLHSYAMPSRSLRVPLGQPVQSSSPPGVFSIATKPQATHRQALGLQTGPPRAFPRRAPRARRCCSASPRSSFRNTRYGDVTFEAIGRLYYFSAAWRSACPHLFHDRSAPIHRNQRNPGA
jgi:hypothetical protein